MAQKRHFKDNRCGTLSKASPSNRATERIMEGDPATGGRIPGGSRLLPVFAPPVQPRGGQSLIESCVVVGIICLLLMGLFQLAQLYMAREIMHYAAARGARSRTVGFNDFMVHKVVRVATIAAAGQMQDRPEGVNSPLAQRNIERSRIPLYLAAEHHGLLSPILDYTNWNTIGYTMLDLGGPVLDCRVRQDFPIQTAVFRAFYRDDSVPLSGSVSLDNHYPLYLYQP